MIDSDCNSSVNNPLGVLSLFFWLVLHLSDSSPIKSIGKLCIFCVKFCIDEISYCIEDVVLESRLIDYHIHWYKYANTSNPFEEYQVAAAAATTTTTEFCAYDFV